MRSAKCRDDRPPLHLPNCTYRAVVEYDGTDLHGFQWQPKLRTVAGELEAALSLVFDQRIKVTGAGRTDAGVHAVGQVISFTTQRAFPLGQLMLALNGNVGSDVSICALTSAPEGFSARLDALERRYVYVILNCRQRSALARRYAYHCYHRLDVGALRQACQDLVGTHDFSSFCGVAPQDGDTVRTIFGVDIEQEPPILRLRFRARGFLHRMVRVMTGTLLEIAAGRRPPDAIPALLAAGDRRAAGFTAPPQGLFFAGVRYVGFDSNPGNGLHFFR